MDPLSWCKELWTPKTFNRFSFVANSVWIAIGIILFAVFLDMEINEARFDFRCDVNTANIDKDFIRGVCFVQYEKRYNKLSIPLYGFVILNFGLPVIVCVIYSLLVKSRVHQFEASNADIEVQVQPGNSTQRNLFTAYCCQLVTRLCLGALFIIILQIQVCYPRNFPSDFKCNLMRKYNHTANTTENTKAQTYECHNQRAHKKTSWAFAVSGANGILALVLLTEVLIILSRARKGKSFMEDSQFFLDHLQSNFDPPKEEQIPLLTQQEQELQGSQDELNLKTPEELQRQDSIQLQAFLKSMKDSVVKGTKRLRDLASPFQTNPGEGDKTKEMNLDQIYTQLIIYPGRAHYKFTGDRREQLKVYPKPEANLPPTRPEDIVDAPYKNILVVGRPGIGKTLFCTKLLRDWASDRVFNKAQNAKKYFDIAFLLKFRRFNFASHLNLRELLARSEFSTTLNDEVWDYILENPSRVLIIFDGIDEFYGKKQIAKDDSYYSVEEKMPVHALYNKITSGKLLDGATVLTTTRPTAVSCIRHCPFQRTVEILGFTTQQFEDYVEKFTEDDKDAKETIWEHISSNLNLFSLCYIPVNSFIICSCLLHILKMSTFNSTHGLASLPTKITHIYSFATKLFFFRHSDRYRYETDGQDIIYEPFDNLPGDVKRDFDTLGRIAFKGIEEGRLIFGSDEVTKLEDCGLLHRLPDLEAPAQRPFEKPKAQFCFMHLTMQEFLAAKHVTDTMTDAELREFVSGHIKHGAWQVVMQFVAGLLGDRKEPLTDIFIDLLPVSTASKEDWTVLSAENETSENLEPRRTLICWPTVNNKDLALTLCQCLNEIGGKDSALQNKIREIGFNALDFSNHTITPIDLFAVMNLLKNYNGMLSMDLRNTHIGSLGCKQIQKLFANRNGRDSYCKLSNLNLAKNDITDEGVKYLVELLTHSNCKLNSLTLNRNKLTDEGVKNLVEALTHINCKLYHLSLGSGGLYSSISHVGVKYLIKAFTHSNCKLSSLSLNGNHITHEGVKHLVKALTHSNCKLSSLNLCANRIADKGVKHLVEVLTHSNCKLSSLNLSFNCITDKGVKHLIEAFTNSNCKLSSLNLSNNDLSNEDVKHFVQALTNSNCKLNSLDLTNNAITNTGAKHLIEALTHSNCKLRSLYFNYRTDEGVKHVVVTHKQENFTCPEVIVYPNKGAKHLAKKM